MKLYIKNMVCDRCIMTVEKELEAQQLPWKMVRLGEVELVKTPSETELKRLNQRLSGLGFELLDDKRSQVVEKIKNAIVSLVHRGEDDHNLKMSAYLEQKLEMDYHSLTTLFTAVEGVTIEKYLILQRIERVKELLWYDELSLSEIADQTGYSSVQHLSQQFKKVTGTTPSAFRASRENSRRPLDKLS
ncbi:helix-turn-helix domain-containing protein [Flavihumibacter petaseus]|uniref:Putative AraC family transcriptional regulator n=1 Tax=Flavihumibacter petaseus NBRC 106054 TaxID=1220578 RepID=A0A0E9N1T6_9BACT|nr:AraC family transcriptional regulator [Flavihumibacter petaseus]GAO43977.1 putative AraC family transcriptional regulator [Flavihumibacter petaseus NBRC 106054]